MKTQKYDKKYKYLSHFFYEIGTLRKLTRSHRQTLLTDDQSDNIASHSYRVTFIGWFIAKEEKADANKVLLMGLLHDLGEARSGDQNWVHKRYVKVFENQIIKEQFSKLPYNMELSKLAKEYDKRKTLEAKIAKDADLLDQILLLKEYAWQGNNEARLWLKDNAQKKMLETKTAKRLAKEIMEQKPNEWWWNIWTPKRR